MARTARSASPTQSTRTCSLLERALLSREPSSRTSSSRSSTGHAQGDAIRADDTRRRAGCIPCCTARLRCECRADCPQKSDRQAGAGFECRHLYASSRPLRNDRHLHGGPGALTSTRGERVSPAADRVSTRQICLDNNAWSRYREAFYGALADVRTQPGATLFFRAADPGGPSRMYERVLAIDECA